MLASKEEGAEFINVPSISNPLRQGCSIHRLRSRDKFSAIREIVDNCPVFNFLDDVDFRESFIQEVFRRESLCTTGIGHNVAIPHGKCDTVDRVRIGLGISEEGIDFGAIDGEPVHLIFVIASNPIRQTEYLKSLAFLMNHLKNPILRASLKGFSSLHQTADEENFGHFVRIMKSQIFSYQ